jgi:hypothetical protein
MHVESAFRDFVLALEAGLPREPVRGGAGECRKFSAMIAFCPFSEIRCLLPWRIKVQDSHTSCWNRGNSGLRSLRLSDQTDFSSAS